MQPPLLDETKLVRVAGDSTVEPDFLGFSPASWTRLVEREGPVFRQVQGNDPKDTNYIICGHDADLQAWRSPENWIYGPPSTGGEFFNSQLGEQHVTQLDGAAHRRVRKFVLPGFGIAAVTRDLSVVADCVSAGIENLPQREVDLHPTLSRVIASALCKSQVKQTLSVEDIDLMVDFEEGFIAAAGLSETERAQWYASAEYSAARAHAFGLFEQIVDRRLGGERKNDSLDLVMEKALAAGESELSREELTSITYLLAVAGVGNIANILCAALWALEQHPVWLDRLAQELAGFTPSSLREGMAQWPVLKAVISEAERCYLPAPVVPKMAASTLTFMGYEIPAGANVLHMHGLAHFDAQRYEHPLEFNPGRWLEDKAPRANAFGGGIHLCLGMGVTRLYVPLILAQMVKRYRWQSDARPSLVPISSELATSPRTTRFVTQLISA